MKKNSPTNLKILLTVLFLGYTIIYLDKLSIAYTIIPIATTFGLSAALQGLLMSGFFLGYAVMQIPMSALINKIGAKTSLLFSVIAAGLFSFLFKESQSISMLVMMRIATGSFAHSLFGSAASEEVVSNFPEEKRTFVQGILMASSGFVAVLAPLLIPSILAQHNWTLVYVIFSFFYLLVALLFMFVLPKDYFSSGGEPKHFREAFKDVNLYLLVISSFAINTILYGLVNWLPTFFTTERGLSLSRAGKLNIYIGIFSLIGALGGSYIVSKYFCDKESIIIKTTPLIGATLSLMGYFSQNIFLSTLLFCLGTLFLTVAFVTIMSLPLKIFAQGNFTTKYAAIMVGGILGGAFTPIFIGVLVEQSGNFLSSFFFFILIGIFNYMVLIFFKNRNNSNRS